MKKICLLATIILTAFMAGCSDYETEVTAPAGSDADAAFMFSVDSTTVPDTLKAVTLERLNAKFNDAFVDTMPSWLDSVVTTGVDSTLNGLTALQAIQTVNAAPTGSDGIYLVEVTGGKRSSFATLTVSGNAELSFYFNNFVKVDLWKTDGTFLTEGIYPSASAEMVGYMWTTDYQNTEKINNPSRVYVGDGTSLEVDNGSYILRLQKAEAVAGAKSFKMMIIEN